MSELNILIRWVITSGIFYAFELTISKFKWIAQFNCCLVIRRHTEKGLQKSKEKIKDNSEFVRESCYRQLQWWVKYISWKEKTVKAFFSFSFWRHVIWIARVLEIASREHFQLWPLIFRFGIHLFTFSVSFFLRLCRMRWAARNSALVLITFMWQHFALQFMSFHFSFRLLFILIDYAHSTDTLTWHFSFHICCSSCAEVPWKYETKQQQLPNISIHSEQKNSTHFGSTDDSFITFSLLKISRFELPNITADKYYGIFSFLLNGAIQHREQAIW